LEEQIQAAMLKLQKRTQKEHRKSTSIPAALEKKFAE
jgi:hypothetical protein